MLKQLPLGSRTFPQGRRVSQGRNQQKLGLFFDPEDASTMPSEVLGSLRTTGCYDPEDHTFQMYKEIVVFWVMTPCSMVFIYQNTWCHNSEHHNLPLHFHHHENLKSDKHTHTTGKSVFAYTELLMHRTASASHKNNCRNIKMKGHF
jgi:hypothetical protein